MFIKISLFKLFLFPITYIYVYIHFLLLFSKKHKKSVENAKNPELKFEDGYKTSVRKEVNNSKILSKNKDIYTEECQLVYFI